MELAPHLDEQIRGMGMGRRRGRDRGSSTGIGTGHGYWLWVLVIGTVMGKVTFSIITRIEVRGCG